MYEHYHIRLRNAYLEVVKDCVKWIEGNDLENGSEVCITFNPSHEGVELPEYLAETYPHGMTIVLKRRTHGRNLKTYEEGFSANLVLDGVPTNVRVPWARILSYVHEDAEFVIEMTDSYNQATDNYSYSASVVDDIIRRKLKETALENQDNVIELFPKKN